MEKLNPTLNSHWIKKAFSTFYPLCEPVPTNNAPDNWRALSQFPIVGKLPVFNGSCENTIYANDKDNVIFRAWHDCVHIENSLNFSVLHEKK